MSASDEEFERSIRDFGMTKWYIYSTIASGLALAVLSIAMIAVSENTVVAMVLLLLGVAAVALGIFALKRVKHIESDPSAKNPRRNPVARGLFRLEKQHPVLNAIIGLALVLLILWTFWLRIRG